MKALLLVAILGVVFLAGCMPNPVSVSRDGTIALTLDEDGEYQLFQDDGQQVYLTNLKADFLEKVEGMNDCRFPVISPCGRYVAACSGENTREKLLLYDRKTEERRVIYRIRKADPDVAVDFPVWSPDGKKIAFFEADYETVYFTLKVYEIKSRELQIVDRRAFPQATWMPHNRRLVYLSSRQTREKGEVLPAYNLGIANIRTGKQKTLIRGGLLGYTKIAAFPSGKAILFPWVEWENMEVSHAGLTAPIILRKEPLSRGGRRAARARREEPGEEFELAEELEAAPSRENVQALPKQEPDEKPFILSEGQLFHPYACSVSPNGMRMAYVCARCGGTPEGEEGEEPDPQQVEPNEAEKSTEKATEVEEDSEELRWEICVARADGTGGIAVVRAVEGFAQVLWVSNIRLICATGFSDLLDSPPEGQILLVDGDGKNKLDLIQAIRAKFADRFEEEGQVEEETEPEKETLSLEETSEQLRKLVRVGVSYKDSRGGAPAKLSVLRRFRKDRAIELFVEKKIASLKELRKIAHPDFHAVIENYIKGLESYNDGRVADFNRLIRAAENLWEGIEVENESRTGRPHISRPGTDAARVNSKDSRQQWLLCVDPAERTGWP